MAGKRIVADTNILLSALLFSGSTPHRAILRAEDEGILLASERTMAELLDVLQRPKFDRAANLALRQSFFREYVRRAKIVTVRSTIQECRDPKDDKFLELAVDGQADLILTGDQDLLTQHPFRGIAILSPTAFLAED